MLVCFGFLVGFMVVWILEGVEGDRDRERNIVRFLALKNSCLSHDMSSLCRGIHIQTTYNQVRHLTYLLSFKLDNNGEPLSARNYLKHLTSATREDHKIVQNTVRERAYVCKSYKPSPYLNNFIHRRSTAAPSS